MCSRIKWGLTLLQEVLKGATSDSEIVGLVLVVVEDSDGFGSGKEFHIDGVGEEILESKVREAKVPVGALLGDAVDLQFFATGD